MLILVTCLLICFVLHELGHLSVAKLCKCKVEHFSIGIKKPVLFKYIFNGTTYQITPWLIGGECKLEDESFYNLRYLKKLSIFLAGCFVNIVTGFIGLIVFHFTGIYQFYVFGYIAIVLGLTNLLPIPALDGCAVILVGLEKFYGKEKARVIESKLCNIGMRLIIAVNILTIPYIIYVIANNQLTF